MSKDRKVCEAPNGMYLLESTSVSGTGTSFTLYEARVATGTLFRTYETINVARQKFPADAGCDADKLVWSL